MFKKINSDDETAQHIFLQDGCRKHTFTQRHIHGKYQEWGREQGFTIASERASVRD